MAAVAPAALEAECHSTDTNCDGDDTCHPGGELVTVRRVIDGDTLELADSRRVRLLGIDAPEVDTCPGPGVTEYTRSLMENQRVNRPDGIYAPPCGKPLVYGDDDGNGVADWEEDVDADVDVPNVNLPDGALTGGYCARRWWC
ncbi:thermonuclease family protein [Pseudonocardia sp. H11422]|uniref:thermonuclease family protein n=1 Tax=Pseudonocardia sp. H11422 TaxID=2835866 RepID=UPI001BDD276B|nr:hypothetical protein [Pseudonocardia sp. H11422]